MSGETKQAFKNVNPVGRYSLSPVTFTFKPYSCLIPKKDELRPLETTVDIYQCTRRNIL